MPTSSPRHEDYAGEDEEYEYTGFASSFLGIMAWIRTAVQIHANGVEQNEEWWYDLHQFFLCLPKSIVYDEDEPKNDEDNEDNEDDEDDEDDEEDKGNKLHNYDDFYVVIHSEVR